MTAIAEDATVRDTSSTIPNEHNAEVPQTKYNITLGTDINTYPVSKSILKSSKRCTSALTNIITTNFFLMHPNFYSY
jgi:hypothetical protein